MLPVGVTARLDASDPMGDSDGPSLFVFRKGLDPIQHVVPPCGHPLPVVVWNQGCLAGQQQGQPGPPLCENSLVA